jgi:hypothetical protein
MRISEFGNPLYRQSFNTCVLASYGVACFPFTHQPIGDYFLAYCRHFALDQTLPEASYERHFHSLPSGYDVIETLHLDATDSVFSACRANVLLIERFEAGHGTQMREQALVSDPGLVMLLSFSPKGLHTPHFHSVAINYDETESSLYYYDTNTAMFSKISHLEDLGQPGEAFFLTRRSAR